MSTTNIEEPTVTGQTVGTNRWYLSSAPIVRALVPYCPRRGPRSIVCREASHITMPTTERAEAVLEQTG
jgi:hypothetical protein